MRLVNGLLTVALGTHLVHAGPCMEMTLTGVLGGATVHPDIANAGVFVRVGDSSGKCNGLQLQFDCGRGTVMRMYAAGGSPEDLGALFLTHRHIDHTVDVADLLMTRWLNHRKGTYEPLHVFATTHGAAQAVNKSIDPFLDDLMNRTQWEASKPYANLTMFDRSHSKQLIFYHEATKTSVSAVAVTHTPGAVGYRVDSPAGSICISGDTAVGPYLGPMCEGVDILVHEVVWRGLSPELREMHSLPEEVGKLAQKHNVQHLVLSHFQPPPCIGERRYDSLLQKVFGDFVTGALPHVGDYRSAIRQGGYTGALTIGRDLVSLHLGTPCNTDSKAPGFDCPPQSVASTILTGTIGMGLGALMMFGATYAYQRRKLTIAGRMLFKTQTLNESLHAYSQYDGGEGSRDGW